MCRTSRRSPGDLIVARAYLDQLNRSGAMGAERIAALKTAMAKVEASRGNRKDAEQLSGMGASMEKDAASAKTRADAERRRALAGILRKNAAARP